MSEQLVVETPNYYEEHKVAAEGLEVAFNRLRETDRSLNFHRHLGVGRFRNELSITFAEVDNYFSGCRYRDGQVYLGAKQTYDDNLTASMEYFRNHEVEIKSGAIDETEALGIAISYPPYTENQ